MNVVVLAGNEDNRIAQKIARQLQVKLIVPQIDYFADGELHVSFAYPSYFVDKVVLLVQSTSRPVNEHLLQILFLTHELKNIGAKKIIGVIPYFGYSRQEASDVPGKPGQAVLVASMLQAAGMDSLFTVALHTPTIESFFSIPIVNVHVTAIIEQHIQQQFDSLDNVCLVAPDKGAQDRVEAIAQKLGIGFLTIIKERYAPDEVRITKTIGTCRGTTAIIIDDIIATGGTVLQAVDKLDSMGFKQLYGYFIHPVFAGNAFEKIIASKLQKIFVSNTIPLQQQNAKVEVFDVSKPIIAAIKRTIM